MVQKPCHLHMETWAERQINGQGGSNLPPTNFFGLMMMMIMLMMMMMIMTIMIMMMMMMTIIMMMMRRRRRRRGGEEEEEEEKEDTGYDDNDDDDKVVTECTRTNYHTHCYWIGIALPKILYNGVLERLTCNEVHEYINATKWDKNLLVNIWKLHDLTPNLNTTFIWKVIMGLDSL